MRNVIAGGILGAVCLMLPVGCAVTDAHFAEGQRAFAAGEWKHASEEFDAFSVGNCRAGMADPGCKEAKIRSAEALLRLGRPTAAYFVLDTGKQFGPFDGPLNARLYALEKEAQDTLAARLTRVSGEGTLVVTFESKTTERFRFKEAKFVMDLHPIPTDRAPYVARAKVVAVPPTVIPAGDHELEVRVHYESASPLAPGYHFVLRESHAFRLSAGASGKIHVRVSERSPQSPAQDALVLTEEDQGAGVTGRPAFE